MIGTITDAIVGHLVGDYLAQNDWLAANKKKNSAVCALHCLVWTASVTVFSGWYSIAAILILFAMHFIQDRTNVIRQFMRLNQQEAFATGPCSPWSIIVVDNVWHIVTIWAVGHWIIGA